MTVFQPAPVSSLASHALPWAFPIAALTWALALFATPAMAQEEAAEPSAIGDAIALYNNLGDLIAPATMDEAVSVGVRMHELHAPLFRSFLHDTLAQSLEHDDRREDVAQFLGGIQREGGDEMQFSIQPIRLAARSVSAREDHDATSFSKELENLLGDASDYERKTERYGLFILREFESRGIWSRDLVGTFLKRIIENLESDPSLQSRSNDSATRKKRAWHRYMLAYSYNYYAEVTIDGLYVPAGEADRLMGMLARYSPNQEDRFERAEYFYDACVLHKGDPVLNFRAKYVRYLESSGAPGKALPIQLEEAFLQPSDENLEWLQRIYSRAGIDQPFREYWHDYLDSRGYEVSPVEIEFESEVLALGQEGEGWTYVDVWGTWCAPCVRELPGLQEVFEGNDPEESGVSIYTLSHRSSSLQSFLDRGGYTFPVAEVGDEVIGALGVREYPTHLLVMPTGKILRLNRQVPLQLYLRNFILPAE